MNFVKNLKYKGVQAKEIPCIPGNGAPTTATEGAVGCLYMDTTTGELYKCFDIYENDGAIEYDWTSVCGGLMPLDPTYFPEHRYRYPRGSRYLITADGDAAGLKKGDLVLMEGEGAYCIEGNINGENGTGGAAAFVERARLILGASADSVAIDTVAKTMTIPNDTIIWYGTTKYIQSSKVIVDINITSSAICVLFDYKNNTFQAVPYSSPYCTMAEQYVNICTLRRLVNNTYVPDIGVPYRIDGKLSGAIEQYKERTLSTLKMIAHRGISTYETGKIAPENTLPAIRQAAKNGFKYVEFDVHFTSDNIPVLSHNASINECARNVDGTEITETVNVADKTLEELRTYDFGIFKGEQYAGTKIPTFEEALSACRKLGLHPYIEVKSATVAQVQQLVSIVKKFGFANDCTWLTSTTNAQHLPAHSRIGLVSYGDITEETIQTVLSTIEQGYSVFFDVHLPKITDAIVQTLAENNIPLELWTVYGKDNIPSLVDYATGVTAECGAYYLANEIFDSEANKAVTEL